MAVRLKDIAQYVGVKESTVSVVLNRKTTRIKVSDETSNKIFQAAKDLGYHPNASAKALITKRTGYIGFILSDTTTDGWRNDYFAAHLVGVERACHKRGYGLTISLYNLSNISSFVFPTKVGQRSIDGVLLTGYIQKEVANEFKKFGLPCICLGDDLEIADLMASASTQVIEGRFMGAKYLAELGHRRIGYPFSTTPRGQQVYDILCHMIATDPVTRNCRLERIGPLESHGDYRDAQPTFQDWSNRPAHDRPTAIMHNDQTLIALERELITHGYSCPADVSLMGVCETKLCEVGIPAITSVAFDLEKLGEMAAGMLIDHLVDGKTLDSRYLEYFPARLNIRGSCAPLKK